ncbi:MAG: HK97 gp10 family phage protein [Nitrosomonas sp.]|nr:HK97 gp10 family phage protein [Nitrosomonas sp.]
MATEVKIDGLVDLHKLLQELPAKIEGNVLRGGVRAGTKVFLDRAKSLVPVNSGKLRDSIKIRTRSRKGVVSASLVAGGGKAFYGHMVEFGTAQHFIKPKNRKSLFFAGLLREVVDHPGAQSKPFMRPAFDGGSTEAVNAMAEYIRQRLPKEFKKIGK